MKVAAFAFAASLVLVGCSDSSSTPKVEPATGPKISADGYSFNAPSD